MKKLLSVSLTLLFLSGCLMSVQAEESPFSEPEALPAATEMPTEEPEAAPEPEAIPASADDIVIEPVEAEKADSNPDDTPHEAPVPKSPSLPDGTRVIDIFGRRSGFTMTLYLAQTLYFDGAASIKCSSSAVSVDSSLVVTAKSEGTASLTATLATGKKITIKLKVVDPYAAASVSFAEGKSCRVPLDGSKTYRLGTAVTAAGGAAYTANTELTFTSSSKKVLSVDEYGVITPLSKGTATVTVTTANKKKASIKVTVFDPHEPASVSFNDGKTRKITLEGDTTYTLAVTINTAADGYDPDKTLTFTSSNKKVLIVDSEGIITPLAKGTSSVTVTTGNKKKATIKITVYDPHEPASVSFNEGKTLDIRSDEEYTLVPMLKPLYENAEPATKYTWKSSNTKVLKVEDGRLLPQSAGTASVTVTTANGKKATIKVIVTDAKLPKSVWFTVPDEIEMELGSTYALTYDMNAIGSSCEPYRDVTWSTSNKAVAAVSASGVVTAQKTGTAIITVKTRNGLTANVTIIVKKGRPLYFRDGESVTLHVGDTHTLEIVVDPDQSSRKLTLYVSDSSVCQLNPMKYTSSTTVQCRITALSTGTAELTLSSATGQTAALTVYVQP